MKIGITGASGHVGANLVRDLLKEGYEIRALEHSDHTALKGLTVERVIGDLSDFDSLDTFCKELDVLVHLAARISIRSNSFERLYEVNVEGTKNLVRVAKKAGVKRYIHFSSIHALDHHPLSEPMDELRPLMLDAVMPYERTKAIAEAWVRTQQTQNFDVIILYPSAILGPNDFKGSLVGQFIIRLYNRTLPGLVRGGYDWVDVRDVSAATVQAIKTGKGGDRYILSGTWMSVSDFARLFSDMTGRKTVRRIIPLWLTRVGVPFIFLWAVLRNEHPLYTFKSLKILQHGNRRISCAKAKKELGYHPRPLDETIRDTVEWFKANGDLT
ncbi:MAG: NAD-dependent epimerase/dehydratase family protein [Bacteroidales bacterium]|nr:NAD-dependent epimerase/dehydratase family protein [Bacteroidales bacterium]